jgi:hypothetical protein
MMLELDLLRSFVSVVDTGGFTRAGERVNRIRSCTATANRRRPPNKASGSSPTRAACLRWNRRRAT